jgi:hypothetical protein
LEIWIPDMSRRNLGVRKSVPIQSGITVEIPFINKCKPPSMKQEKILVNKDLI